MDLLKSLYLPFSRMRRLQKTQKLSTPDDENPKLFQLNVDCFDEIFDYLSLSDLCAFGQTCRRMNKVAGEYFKRNHLSTDKCFTRDGNFILFSGYYHCQTLISDFNKFVPYITEIFDNMKYPKSLINTIESTNHIRLKYWRKPLKTKTVRCFEKLWPQLKILHIKNCSVDGDLYDIILKHCQSNLKELYLQHTDMGKRTNGTLNWLLQEYPKLECLHLTTCEVFRIDELNEFFVCNPSIKRFTISATLLLQNGDIFLNSNIKLDEFKLYKNCLTSTDDRCPCMPNQIQLLILLNQLHDQGFFKRLHIYIRDGSHGFGTESLASVKGLELLYIRHFDMRYNLVELTNLRELIIRKGSWYFNEKDMEILANSLTNLNRLWIQSDGNTIDVIMPFIRRSLNLNKLKFVHHNRIILNLAMLNEERAKLVGARKIMLFVRDDVFLHAKWSTRNGDINLNFIEVRRSNSIYWNHKGFNPKIT